jgi:hypothetical protein
VAADAGSGGAKRGADLGPHLKVRPYLAVSGGVFTLLAIVDLWDLVQVMRHGTDSSWYVPTIIVFFLATAGLAWWAWRLYARTRDD